jgi:hypothetical protein
MRLKPIIPANAAAEFQTAIRLADKFAGDVVRGAEVV